MEIRAATLKDLNDIQKLNLMLFKKEQEEYDSLLNLKWTFGKEGTEYFKKKLTKEDSCVFVADVKGEVVGYLAGGEVRAEDYRKLPKVAELESMFVLEQHRGKGVGTKLNEGFIKWCKSRKVQIIRVQASAPNNKAIRFYRKKGFESYTLILEKKI